MLTYAFCTRLTLNGRGLPPSPYSYRVSQEDSARRHVSVRSAAPLSHLTSHSALTAPFTRFIFSDLAASVPRKQRDSLGKFPLQLGREEPVAEVLEEGATRRLRVGAEAALRAKERKKELFNYKRGGGRAESAL